ncbi:MAG: xylulokinase, partial [Spirochaetaceae bacterium]
MHHIVGIDIGTSAVKLIIIDEKQYLIKSVSIPLQTDHNDVGWSEQHPDIWWEAVVNGFTKLGLGRKELGKITAIGVTGQMHGMVILDETMQPICPAILWNDSRAVHEAAILHDTAPGLAEKTGVMPMAGLTAPKLLWLRNNQPENFKKIRWLLSPKDYVNFKLTGRIASDYSDAAGTWFLDQAKREWSKEAIALVGMSPDQFPELIESCDSQGCLTQEASAQLGLSKKTIVAGGGGDTPVGALGLGCTRTGSAEISLGTSAHVLGVTQSYTPAVETLVHSFCHALPDTWFQMAAMLNGASALSWIC